MSKTQSKLGTTIPTPYLVYTALMSQTGINAPTAVVLQNTLGGTIVWTYDSVGVYVGTLVGAFPANKVWFSLLGIQDDGNITYAIERVDDDSLKLKTFDGAVVADVILSSSSLEIRVYP